MGLNPIEVTQHINDAYFRYLSTAFNISDPELHEQFNKELKQPERFIKGPYLEITPAFRKGKNIQELIKEGVLVKSFQKLAGTLDFTRPLYDHQERALRKILLEKRNLIVATGTGSGKTETFLYPILNTLLEEYEKTGLSPGVRALLLYPMNALANDQMKRLRKLLKGTPITFGRYTGETREGKEDAEKDFRLHNPQEERIPNEFLSREEMREKPPHILLTNYAMLEFLLMRPADCSFFENQWGQTWKFIVLDEAHTYNGAKGMEMAMLLRRLKDRVVGGKRGVLRCIATSATLGRGREDFPEVVQFGEKLFGEKFEWVANDPVCQDVIEASKLDLNQEQCFWGRPEPEFYLAVWQALQEKKLSVEILVKLAKDFMLPPEIIERARHTAGSDVKRLLYELLKGDETLKQIRDYLGKPSSLIAVANQVFATPQLVDSKTAERMDSSKAQRVLIAFVDLAVLARPEENDQPLLPARYHLFARALEGAFISLYPSPKLYLDRKKHLPHQGEQIVVFELGACKRCGQEYIVGRVNEASRLVQPGGLDAEQLECYLIRRKGQEDPQGDEDEEVLAAVEEEENAKSELYELCSICGHLKKLNTSQQDCLCQQAREERIWLLQKLVKPKKNKQQQCLSCGARAEELILRFLTGQDAPTSVLASALYEKIPVKNNQPESVAKVTEEADEFSEDFSEFDEVEVENTLESQGRKLLAFSDSRQDAAFFACYLNRTYQQILWRRLIVRVLQRTHLDTLRIDDIVRLLVKEAEEFGLFSRYHSNSQRQAEAYKWAMTELLALDKGHSLEGLGLVRFRILKPHNWKPVSYFANTLKMDEDTTWQLHEMLFNSFRHQGAVTFPEDISPKDEHFAPRNRPHYFKERGSIPKLAVFAWLPAAKKLNARVDYLTRVLLRRGFSEDAAKGEVMKVLEKGFWDIFTKPGSPTWKNYFKVFNKEETGSIYQVDYRLWEAVPTRPGDKWYRCSDCGTVSHINIAGVCPKYRCQGTLKEVDLEKSLANNHYRQLYLKGEPVPMIVEEHTAQLTGKAAAELQEKFSNGEVNILSCSTTFEMGVDVGDLEAVFMRNVPPETANYIQRAGRAGRRTESTAFALTYAQRRPHDLHYFAEPEKIIAGTINPPHFEMTNEKIIQRHMYAVALARFFRIERNREYFGSVDAFFRPEEETGGLEKFQRFMETKPGEVLVSLTNIIPSLMHERLQPATWAWLKHLLDPEKGVLVRACQEVRSDIESLWQEKKKRDEERKPSDYLLRIIKTIKERNLLGYLSSRNVLPKYGFPVDVVELKIDHHSAEGNRLALDRDLRIAISEYAPGSQVVAGGRLWTSAAIKQIPKLGWDEYYYSVCKECHRYHSARLYDEVGDNCRACGEPLETKVKFIVPIFGFVTGQEKPGVPGEKRPDRSFSSRIYFAEYYKDLEDKYRPLAEKELNEGKYSLNHCELFWRYSPFGKLAVVNRGVDGGGFKVCRRCGYAKPSNKVSNKKDKNSHKTTSGADCEGTLAYCHLGHEFMSDIVELRFEGLSSMNNDFWLSFLYALLEGTSEALSITRSDIDGCLYYHGKKGTNPAIVIFDNVPGGAGHAKRIGPHMPKVLWGALHRVNCSCGMETSCYGCLRNFSNQFCHDQLSRGPVKQLLERLLS